MARRKTKKVFSRRSHASYANAPTTSFEAFKDYARTEIDKKETAKIIKEYVRKNFSRKEAKVMLSAPDYHFTRPYYVASTNGRILDMNSPITGITKSYLTDTSIQLRLQVKRH